MREIQVKDEAVGLIEKIQTNMGEEKQAVADALTTVIENMQQTVDKDEYLNVCAVLGRYNRLISLL